MRRFSRWQVKNARRTVRIWRVFMPFFTVFLGGGAMAGKLVGGFEALGVAYLIQIAMFQMARSDAGFPVRKRNLVFQP